MRIGFFLVLVLVVAVPSRATDAVLVGQFAPTTAMQYTDVWGWVDPQTSKEYALVGNNATALWIVDVTDPSAPFTAGSVNSVPRFDMKTWGSLVYTVDGFTAPGGIVDISDPYHPIVVGSFPGGHNIWIDTEGFLYVCLPGLKCYDLNYDPTSPYLVWNIDVPEGHDCAVVGKTLYEFRGTAGTFIWDVSNRYVPRLKGSIIDSTITYNHSGWPTEDRHYLFITDEYALDPAPDITVWDLSTLPNPQRVGAIYDPNSTVHNCYVVGNLLLVAYYTAGFRVYDITDPPNPVLVDTEDIYPGGAEGTFEGAWGCYPFAPSGTVYVSDRPDGLFLFDIEGGPTGVGPMPAPPAGLVVHAGMPNPFGHTTTLRYSLGSDASVSVSVYDAAGRLVRRFEGTRVPAGEHSVTWDGRDARGTPMPSGVYFCRIRAGTLVQTQKMVLVR